MWGGRTYLYARRRLAIEAWSCVSLHRRLWASPIVEICDQAVIVTCDRLVTSRIQTDGTDTGTGR